MIRALVQAPARSFLIVLAKERNAQDGPESELRRERLPLGKFFGGCQVIHVDDPTLDDRFSEGRATIERNQSLASDPRDRACVGADAKAFPVDQ